MNMRLIVVIENVVPLLVQLHGTLMVTAWMLFAPCGILLARHFNSNDRWDPWMGKQIMGKDRWMVVRQFIDNIFDYLYN